MKYEGVDAFLPQLWNTSISSYPKMIHYIKYSVLCLSTSLINNLHIL